ncbi:MAG: LL-diaminopimelate aminotransferase [Clostridiales bacterium]|nr:LL-diaminopimelate aminotransferase [Clostridiales bacterium]
MNIKINENFNHLAQNYLFSEIAKRVKAYTEKNPDAKIIRMGIGDVTRPLCPHVVSAMKNAVEEMGKAESFRGYPPEYGYDFLREAIAAHYASFGVTVAAGDIFVSDGAKSDCGNIVDIFGDNTIYIPDPVYPVYMDSNIMSGRTIKLIPATVENGFLPMPKADFTTGVYYLCSPNNPTGAAYSAEQLQTWVDFALDTGSVILFDAAYEAFVSDDSPRSIYAVPGAEKCAIEFASFSKTAGFTGTRCGYTVVPAALKAGDTPLQALWARRQATKFNGVSYPVQRAAEAAYSQEGLAQCMENISYYMNNAALMAELMREKGIFFTGGKNSPYVWFKCPNGMDSWSFFDKLLTEAQVVGTPGAGFGACGEGFFRLSSFNSLENTKEAVERLRGIL